MAFRSRDIVFDDWSGGIWSAHGPYVAGTMTPFKYDALNLQVYRNGSIGPRPKWKRLPLLDNLSAAYTLTGATGFFNGATWVPAADRATYGNGWLLFAHGGTNSDHRINMETGVADGFASVSGSGPGLVESGNNNQVPSVELTYMNPAQVVATGSSIINIDNGTEIAITMPTNFAADRGVFHRNRLYIWGDNSASSTTSWPNRIFYSDSDAFATFPSAAFFDLGGGGTTGVTKSTVQGALSMRNGLLMWSTQDWYGSQGVGQWWMLTGANPLTGALQTLEAGPIPNRFRQVVKHSEQLWFLGKNDAGIITTDGNKIDNKTLKYLAPHGPVRTGTDTGPGEIGRPVASGLLDALYFPFTLDETPDTEYPEWESGWQAFARVNDVWTRSAPSGLEDTALWYPVDFSNFEHDKLIMVVTDDNADSDASRDYEVYTRDVTLDRPSNDEDTWSSHEEVWDASTDLFDAHLYLPEYHVPANHMVRVEQIEIDLDYWNNASSPEFAAPSLDVSLRYSARGDRDATTQYKTTDLTESTQTGWPSAGSSLQPRRRKLIFLCNKTIYAGTWQVRIDGIDSVAIHSVTVRIGEDNNRPVGS